MDLTTARANLDLWLAALTALAGNSSYTISFPNGSSRSLDRQSIPEVMDMITYWDRVVNTLDARANGARNPGVRLPAWR